MLTRRRRWLEGAIDAARDTEVGGIGYILVWLAIVPLPMLLLIVFLQGGL